MQGSIRTRLLASFLAVALVAAAGLSYYFLTQIEAYGLRKLEERLGSETRTSAALLGALYEETAKSSVTGLPASRVSQALKDASSDTSSRLRVIGSDGVVLADSGTPSSVGSSFRDRPEIARALRGAYGAATRKTDLGRVALYVAWPITANGRVVGATYASSTTFSILTLLYDYRRQLALLIVGYVIVALLVAEALGRWLTGPLRKLETGAAALASDHSVRVEPEGPREVRALAEAFNQLARDIETSTGVLYEEERRKSRFVSDVSHELRTPLTAIRGAAETLLEEGVSDEDRRRFLSRIVNESDRLARLANDLLTLQRIEGATGELPLGPVDLRRVATLAVESLEHVASERGVAVALSGEAPVILGDRDRLQQVIANLIDNATRMSPAGGRVDVRLSEEGGRSVVVVSDQGPGIPTEDLPRLFDRFFRSEMARTRTTGGAGLGLAIVKAIVDGHGGEIEARNLPGSGAQFIMRFPVSELRQDA